MFSRQNVFGLWELRAFGVRPTSRTVSVEIIKQTVLLYGGEAHRGKIEIDTEGGVNRGRAQSAQWCLEERDRKN